MRQRLLRTTASAVTHHSTPHDARFFRAARRTLAQMGCCILRSRPAAATPLPPQSAADAWFSPNQHQTPPGGLAVPYASDLVVYLDPSVLTNLAQLT